MSKIYKKLIWITAAFLVVLGLVAVFLMVEDGAGTRTVFASQEKKADDERIPTEVELFDPNDKRPLKPLHKHPAFTERVKERVSMVFWQIQARD